MKVSNAPRLFIRSQRPVRTFSADQFVRENLFDTSRCPFAAPSSRDKEHSVSAILSESGVMFGISLSATIR
jgi:hypothetical protein